MRKLFQNIQMHFDFMDVILLRSGHQHVSATCVAIFRVVRTKNANIVKIYLSHSEV